MINKALIVALSLVAGVSMAQDNNDRRTDDRRGGEERGRWDPAQMQQRFMDMLKERLEVTDDAEWKAIQPRVEKVSTTQRQVTGDRLRGIFGRRGGDSNRGDSNRGGSGGGMFGNPLPEADALQRAVDSKASKNELKSALNKYVEARKAKEAELERAQADLRKVLTPRQEAIATLMGLL